METFIPFQKYVTLQIDGPGEIIQSRSGHLDLADAAAVLVRVEVVNITDGAPTPGTGATLFLETAVSEEGPWFPVDRWDSMVAVDLTASPLPWDETLQLATYYSAQNKLARFLRWRFTTTVSETARLTFRMRYQLS